MIALHTKETQHHLNTKRWCVTENVWQGWPVLAVVVPKGYSSDALFSSMARARALS